MAEVNWREVFAVSSLVLALMLIGGSIYLHVQQKHHFGRMHHESSASGGSGVDAAIFMPTQPLQPPPPSASLPSATPSEPDDIDALARVTPRRRFFEEDLASGSGDSESDDSSEEYDKIVKYQQRLEVRVNAIMSSIADKTAISESKSLEDLRESTEDKLPKSSTTNASSSTTTSDAALSSRHITEACLQCVWETVAQCRPASCNSNVPGRISHSYWLDAGKPKLEGDSSGTGEKDAGYAHCVNNAYCAGRAVSAFVSKYARDCNQDGVIDCRDHIALHILGPSGCLTSELQPVFESRMEDCLEKFEGQGQEEKGV